MRRAFRFLYFLGLGVTLLGGTLAFIVLATRLWHPGPEAARLEVWAFAIYFVGGALVGWAGLAYIFRTVVPLPCRSCGLAARAVSLNPIEIRCPHCGDVQRIPFHMHGAS